jgi:hypothetical protein
VTTGPPGEDAAVRAAAEAQARDRLDEAGAALADGVARALPEWAVRRVGDRLAAWGGPVDRPGVLAAARAGGEAAAARVVPARRALFAQDPDDQRSTPLQVVRSAYLEPTAVLREAGVPEVVRDEYAERGWPDDVYGLVVESFTDLDPDLVPWQMVWGAAKATVMRARHER